MSYNARCSAGRQKTPSKKLFPPLSPFIDVCFYQMVFEYQPTGLDVVESLWNFSIPSLSLANPFLLVGQTLDPSVMFDRCYLSFKTLLIGIAILLYCALISVAIFTCRVHSKGDRVSDQ